VSTPISTDKEAIRLVFDQSQNAVFFAAVIGAGNPFVVVRFCVVIFVSLVADLLRLSNPSNFVIAQLSSSGPCPFPHLPSIRFVLASVKW
jgi:hypothetical protein